MAGFESKRSWNLELEICEVDDASIHIKVAVEVVA